MERAAKVGLRAESGWVQVDKILREAPEGTKIYVPIRNAPRMGFEQRFWEKVGPAPLPPSRRSAPGAVAALISRRRSMPLMCKRHHLHFKYPSPGGRACL